MKIPLMIAALAIFASRAVAQTPNEALSRSEREMSCVIYLAGLVKLPDEQTVPAYYRSMSQGAQAFLAAAPDAYAAEALRQTQYVFKAAKLPVPESLPAAAADAERRHDAALTCGLARSWGTVFSWTARTARAEETFGPILDNPALYGSVRSPASGLHLLRNVKWAIDRRVLLREDFYTPQNMARFFGIKGITSRTEDGQSVDFYAGWSGRHLDEPHCSYAFRHLRKIDSRGVRASFQIDCQNGKPGMPSFDDVEAIFGKDWEDGMQVYGALLEGDNPPPARAPRGNQSMVDEDIPPGLRSHRMVVVFDPDAKLAQLRVEEEAP